MVSIKGIKMREQRTIIKKIDNFEPKDIFECGQCFRWNKQEDESYLGVVRENVLRVKKENEQIIIESFGKEDIEKLVEQYFDLKRDYTKIKQELAQIDENMKTSIQYGQGIRLLNQDLWEALLSYIISANNNIPRIKGIIERLAKKYGNKIIWKGKDYYTFPTPEQLKEVTIQEYRALGLGFRDKRVYETTQRIVSKQIDLEKMRQNANTLEVKEQLLRLSGVGNKVADCILLFSDLKRLEVFPIDVWVRRVMNDLYIGEPEEEKVSKKQIEELATKKFGNLAGIAQQYLYYWRREAEK